MVEDNLEKRIKEDENQVVERLKLLKNSKTIPEIISGEHTVYPGTYDIDHDITIKEDGILIIKPGTTINFYANRGLYNGREGGALISDGNGGQIIVQGTKSAPVILQAKTLTWQGVTLELTKKNNTLKYVTIRNAKKEKGGGIHTHDSKLDLEDCTIEQCEAISGGGIYNWGSEITTRKTILKDNIAKEHGGGMYNGESGIVMFDSHVLHNQAGNSSGGIENNFSDIKIETTEIKSNQAKYGGGLNNYKSTIRIINSIVEENIANKGGGVYIHQSKLIQFGVNSIENNTPDNIYERK
jgi:hypothetical protein